MVMVGVIDTFAIIFEVGINIGVTWSSHML